jgi:Protein of unknown function (DUF2752)
MSPGMRAVILPVLGLFVFVAGLRFTETQWRHAMPPCNFHQYTGLYCPGCGGTRCVTRLIHGDVIGAIRANAALVYGLAWLIGWACVSTYCTWKNKPSPTLSPWWLWGSLIVWLVYVIVRNFPWYPWSLLAPR